MAALPFHGGEQEMHFKTGVWQAVESLGRRMIKPAIGSIHADLLGTLPLLLVTARDSGGRLWASALVGAPGFLSVGHDPTLLRVSSARLVGDGMLELRPGQHMGCLGLQFSSRRRVRVNGVLEAAERDPADGSLSLRLRVQQAYTNCPKYIQKRTLQLVGIRPPGSGTAAERGTGALGPAQHAMVVAADTFFIASSAGPAAAGGGGAAEQGSSGSLPPAATAFGDDISHRGGSPGFVQVEEEGRVLRWGDYEGNFMFNTLGNLLANPACHSLRWFAAAAPLRLDRAVRFTVREWTHLRDKLPLRQQGEPEPSPFNPPWLPSQQ